MHSCGLITPSNPPTVLFARLLLKMLTSSLEGFYLFILLVKNVKMLEDLSAIYIESYTP